jgi:hypothetical protein
MQLPALLSPPRDRAPSTGPLILRVRRIGVYGLPRPPMSAEQSRLNLLYCGLHMANKIAPPQVGSSVSEQNVSELTRQ